MFKAFSRFICFKSGKLISAFLEIDTRESLNIDSIEPTFESKVLAFIGPIPFNNVRAIW